MTPDQARDVVLASPTNVLNGVALLDVVGLDGDRVMLTVNLTNSDRTLTFEAPVPYGPLPLAAPELLAVVRNVQDRLGQSFAIFEVQPGRGFNTDGRGGLNSVPGFRADDGWV